MQNVRIDREHLNCPNNVQVIVVFEKPNSPKLFYRDLDFKMMPALNNHLFYAFFILPFLMVAYASGRKRIKAKRKKRVTLKYVLERKTFKIKESMLRAYEIERQNMLLRQEKLNEELVNKSQQIVNYILLIIQKNQFLEDLKIKLKSSLASNGISSGEIKKILKVLSISSGPLKEWEDFNLNFALVYGSFTEKLRSTFPQLTQQDLRLCALYRINSPSKQISEVLGITLSTLKMARYRLRKKLHLSPEEELSDFLNGFSG